MLVITNIFGRSSEQEWPLILKHRRSGQWNNCIEQMVRLLLTIDGIAS